MVPRPTGRQGNGGTLTDRLPLFAGVGVELEYMIVHADTLDVAPRADVLLQQGEAVTSEVDAGPLAWSNELAAHVIELKTNGPAPALHGLADAFQRDVGTMNARLAPHGLRLLPTAMHPWMNPHTELTLWPHEFGPVYETFNRIFDCRGHGWANLQSAHVNLPFVSDAEFRRLHSAIRLVLPIIPALAASSPVVDGVRTGHLDTRLEVYRQNARRVPSVSGVVIPESVDSEAEYEELILSRIYHDLAPLDPHGILRHEWVNARGAIARFDRGTIEIRVIDVQECPATDLAVVAAVVAAVRALVEEIPSSFAAQHAVPTERLSSLLRETIRDADLSVVRDRPYLDLLGVPGTGPETAGAVWRHLIETHLLADPHAGEWRGPISVLLDEGCLARRIVSRLGPDPDPAHLVAVYRDLADGLARGVPFRGRGR